MGSENPVARRGRRTLAAVVVLVCAPAGPARVDEPRANGDVDRLELVEPYRRDCYVTAEREGASPEEARAGIDACVEARMMAAAEAIRVLRLRFPARLTPQEVADCLGPELRPDLFLRCIREKS